MQSRNRDVPDCNNVSDSSYKPVNGKPFERVGRKTVGLSPLNKKDTAAMLPGICRISDTAFCVVNSAKEKLQYEL